MTHDRNVSAIHLACSLGDTFSRWICPGAETPGDLEVAGRLSGVWQLWGAFRMSAAPGGGSLRPPWTSDCEETAAGHQEGEAEERGLPACRTDLARAWQ